MEPEEDNWLAGAIPLGMVAIGLGLVLWLAPVTQGTGVMEGARNAATASQNPRHE